MPSRTSRRRHHKQLAWIDAMADGDRKLAAQRWFNGLEHDLNSRVAMHGVAAGRALIDQPSVLETARHFDPSGELLARLRRACIDAEAMYPLRRVGEYHG